MPDYRLHRINMVETQVRTGDVTDVRIHEAMREVPRERFVPAAKRALAYADASVEVVPGRFLLEPRTFGKMLQAAEIAATDRALDVGCLTGYSTAVLAKMCSHVVGVEQDADAVRIAVEIVPAVGATNAEVVQGGLTEGHKAKAPYDVIFIEGAVDSVPDSLLSQLGEGGRLVTVVLDEKAQTGTQGQVQVFLKQQGHVGRRYAFDAAARPLAGFRKVAGFVF